MPATNLVLQTGLPGEASAMAALQDSCLEPKTDFTTASDASWGCQGIQSSNCWAMVHRQFSDNWGRQTSPHLLFSTQVTVSEQLGRLGLTMHTKKYTNYPIEKDECPFPTYPSEVLEILH